MDRISVEVLGDLVVVADHDAAAAGDRDLVFPGRVPGRIGRPQHIGRGPHEFRIIHPGQQLAQLPGLGLGAEPALLAELAVGADDAVDLIAQGAVAAVGAGLTPMTAYLVASAPAARALDPDLPGRVWAGVHALRTFRADPKPVPPPRRGKDTVEHLLTRAAWAVLYYPLALLLSWLTTFLLAWIGDGERGPFWIAGGVALYGTMTRQVLPRAHDDVAPDGPAIRVFAAVMFALLLVGGWCWANGIARFWFPGIFGGSPVAVGVLFTVSATIAALNVRVFLRRLRAGGQLPYA